MAAGALPGAAEAVAWLQDQLWSERQHMQARHDGLLRGLGQVLGQRADAADWPEARQVSAQSCWSENPMRITGELLEVATRAHGSQPRHVTSVPARVPDTEIIKPMSVEKSRDAPDSEAHSEEVQRVDSLPVRNSKELTEEALHSRGLHLKMAAGRSERPSTYGKAQVVGGTSRGAWICLVWALVQYYSGLIVGNRMFDYCMGVVIIANCVCIGVEIETTVDGGDAATGLQVLEHVFLTTYLVELTMRVLGDWKTCWSNAWFQLDLVLVILGLLSIWVLEPLMKTGGSYEDNAAVHTDFIGVMNKVLVIRILRLIRLARALRFIKCMQPLWKLISGLLGSIQTVVSAALLLFGSMYVFACAGVSLFAQDQSLLNDMVAGPIIVEYFQSVPSLMLTLIQFTSCDSVAAIYHPLIKVKPIMVLYFLPIILVVPISLMNLITAVIVDHAIKASAIDAELERCRLRGRLKELIPVLNNIFSDFDQSHDGKIDVAELDFTKLSRTLPSEIVDVLKSHKLADFFNYLDADGSGQIDQNEWVDGMCCLVLNDVPIENLQMLNLLSRQASDLEALRTALLPGDGHGRLAATGARA